MGISWDGIGWNRHELLWNEMGQKIMGQKIMSRRQACYSLLTSNSKLLVPVSNFQFVTAATG